MIEMTLSISASTVVMLFAVLRLNLMKAERRTLSFSALCEVLGLAGLMGGCAGSIGEWFLPNAEFHAETIVLGSFALFVLGLSRGRLCHVVARLQGWDGHDRRGTVRAS